jgi:hypothetical protein
LAGRQELAEQQTAQQPEAESKHGLPA